MWQKLCDDRRCLSDDIDVAIDKKNASDSNYVTIDDI